MTAVLLIKIAGFNLQKKTAKTICASVRDTFEDRNVTLKLSRVCERNRRSNFVKNLFSRYGCAMVSSCNFVRHACVGSLPSKGKVLMICCSKYRFSNTLGFLDVRSL